MIDRKKVRLLIGAIAVVLLATYLLISSFESIAFIEVNKVMTDKKFQGKRVQVNGTIKEGTVSWNPEKLLLAFKLTDGNHTVDVIYTGSVPSNFGAGKNVIVYGIYEGNTIKSTQILVRCPSKYGEAEKEG